MKHHFQSHLLPLASVAALLGAFGLWVYPDEDVSTRASFPDDQGSLPTITPGFSNWPLCDLESRVETNPPLWSMPNWGPAALTGASGCGCSGTGTYNGRPQSAALGLALAPPHDMQSDAGQLPPPGRDHPHVLASTGEVVYTEVDFVIPGEGFDLVWSRTYRSAYEFSGEMGYGWDFSGQCYLIENNPQDEVYPVLGNGRWGEYYTENAGTYTSPDGYYDKLEKLTRPSDHVPSKFANEPYFKKTEKNGIVWEFDRVNDGYKDVFGCTSISDPWGNEITYEYTDVNDPTLMTKITDTEGRNVTFQRANGRITQVTVSNSSIHNDYGNVTIDYTYTGDRLTKVQKLKTRNADGATVQRQYTDYTYYTSGYLIDDLNLVKYCGTTILDFDYVSAAEDRCDQVTDADGEVHTYLHDDTDTIDDWTKYTDPSSQRRDFVYTDLANGDRTIAAVREYLEDESGNDLSGYYATNITRECDCGQITQLAYSDGSAEKWNYDTWGNLEKYTRTSSNATNPGLVKQWTYDTFANYSRMLTSSGWLRAETNPSSKISYTWTADGRLDKVTWPTVTSGVSASQSIVYDYTMDSMGRLDSFTSPAGDATDYAYSGGTVTITKGSGTSETMVSKYTENVMGTVTSREGHFGSSSAWSNIVTPDGRVLVASGPNGQEVKNEYDLRGRQTKRKTLLSGTSTYETTSYTVSAGGVVTQTKRDDGGISAISTYAIEEGASNRYTESIDPDSYGSRTKWGYGSHNLPWKEYNVDDSGASKQTTRTVTLERNTMGRVTAKVLMGGTRIEYAYDGYGRRTKTTTELPNSKERDTVLTLKDWGAPATKKVKVGTTTYDDLAYHYDEAVRLYKTVKSDPESEQTDRTTEYERDANGRVATRTDGRGGNWQTQRRADGRVKKSIDPVGNEVQYAYDDTNKKVTKTYREKNTSTGVFTDYDMVTTYKAAGWVASVKDEGSAAGNRTTTYTYDKAGRRTQVTLPSGADTDYEYDNLGRMTKKTEEIDTSTTAVTSYTWSDGGQRDKVTDANGYETIWTHDSFGRDLTVAYPVETGVTATYTRTYDTYGRLDTLTDPEGVEIDYTYDTGGRMTRVDVDKGTSVLVGPDRLVFGYDDMDRVTSAKTQENNGGYQDLVTVTRSYDGYGQLESETQHGIRTIQYAYDMGGSVKEITYPSGGPVVGVRYDLDSAGRVTAVDRKLSTAVEGVSTSQWEETATFVYEGGREIKRLQDLYDLKRTQTWTAFREPKVLKYVKDSTSALRTGFEMEWIADGYMTVRERIHDAGGYNWGEVYRYDNMGRLTKMWTNVQNPKNYDVSDPTTDYDDEVLWNLGKVYEREDVKVTPEGGLTETQPYSVPTGGYQYDAVDGATVAWNDNGQMTDWGNDSFSWTALGQLEQAAISGGATHDYVYDAFGRRVETDDGSTTVEYLYHGWHMIGEHDGSDWLWQELPMSRGEGMLEHVALDDADIDGDSNTTEYRQYAVHEDHQHTVWALSETDADVLERYVQDDPFGLSHTLDASQTDIGELASDVHHLKRLHGGAVDKATELYDFRNRWLRTKAGAWMSRDPKGFIDGPNLVQAFMHAPGTYADYFGTTCKVTVERTLVIKPPKGTNQNDATLEEYRKMIESALSAEYSRAKCGECCEVEFILTAKWPEGSHGLKGCLGDDRAIPKCLQVEMLPSDGVPQSDTASAKDYGSWERITRVDPDGVKIEDKGIDDTMAEQLAHEMQHLLVPGKHSDNGGKKSAPANGKPISSAMMCAFMESTFSASVSLFSDNICSFECCWTDVNVQM